MTPAPARVPGCPPDQLLEQVLAGETLAVEQRTHVDGCVHCAARLEWMRSVDQHFTVSVFPRTREAMVERLTRPRFRLLPWLVPAAAVAVAGLLVLFTWRAPPPDYIGMKGSSGEGTFEVYLGENGRGRRLAQGEAVHPGDGLRFFVATTHTDVRAFVLSIDSQGNVSRLYPPSGDAPGPAEGLLPGGAILDEVAGPERLFAVYPDRPLRFEDVEAAAKQAIAGRGAEGVRMVERLPLDVPQDSLLLEKVPK